MILMAKAVRPVFGRTNGLTQISRAAVIRGLPLRPVPARTSASHGQVAQLVEQGTENPRVGGSIPSLATINAVIRCMSCRSPLPRFTRVFRHNYTEITPGPAAASPSIQATYRTSWVARFGIRPHEY